MGQYNNKRLKGNTMRRNLSLLMVVALLLALAAGCSPAKVAEKVSGGVKVPAAQAEQPTKPQPEAASKEAAQQPTAETVEEEPTPTAEDEDVVLRDLDEVDFQSYRAEWRIDTVEEGEEQSVSMLVEYSSEGPAMRTVIAGAEGMEMIRIGDVTYMRSGDDEWLAIESADSDPIDSSFTTFQWRDPKTLFDDHDCKRKGAEDVDGVATIYYRCEPKEMTNWFSADEDVTVEQAYADYYVSKDLGIAVKSVIFWEGQKADQPASYRLETLITDINEPVTITAPEGVAAPGVPADIAIPLDAVDKSSFGTMVSFTVNHPVADVITWYEDQMPSNDWELDADASMTMEGMASQTWHKGGRTATVIISADDENTSVVISVEGE